VLYAHQESGGWSVAPYLDKFGEVDPSLRRNLQLFLNQKRYDSILRNAWLNHQIPSFIARKLEADVNTGGWETL
jgi:E3 ubiquitin-protein ligase UBR1